MINAGFAIIKSNILYNFAAVLSNAGKAFKKKTAQKSNADKISL